MDGDNNFVLLYIFPNAQKVAALNSTMIQFTTNLPHNSRIILSSLFLFSPLKSMVQAISLKSYTSSKSNCSCFFFLQIVNIYYLQLKSLKQIV